jgi:hypothetical protein
MREKPKVSFVCSIRDGEREIGRCVSSVLRQSLENIELILVDDHSQDSTWARMERAARSDQRVRAVKNHFRPGLTYSLNMGLDFASGEYVARIDADDFAHANRAETQVRLMEQNPASSMSASRYRLVDEGDFEMYCHCPASDPKMLRWSLCFRNNIRHSTAMWRRSLDVRYDPSFAYSQDYELWCRISRAGDVAVATEILATIRSRTESITSTRHNEQEEAADRVAAEQFRHYTGRTIAARQARCLRMIQHLKSPGQMRFFERMGDGDLADAASNYCAVAEAFARKEEPDRDSFLADIGIDIASAVGNQTIGHKALRAFDKALRETPDASDTLKEARKRLL